MSQIQWSVHFCNIVLEDTLEVLQSLITLVTFIKEETYLVIQLSKTIKTHVIQLVFKRVCNPHNPCNPVSQTNLVV